MRLIRANRRRAGKLLATLREDGLAEIPVLVRGYIEYRREKYLGARVDRRYGCETGGRIPLEQLQIESPNIREGVQYEPVNEFYLRRMLRTVRIPPDTFLFVDLGSGKGRALLSAAEYPFKRFIGIEFSPELHEIARQNVERFKARTRSEQTFELHLGDAASFEFPLEPIALHLYKPFGERVLRQVMHGLTRSLREVLREVLVYYSNPLHRRVFDDAPFLRQVKGTSQYAVYASDPAHPSLMLEAGARAKTPRKSRE